jgi:CHC2 zinc finger
LELLQTLDTFRRFGKHLLSQHGLEGMELFPKQDKLQTGVGSLVRLPFGIHRKTGKRYYFITSDGKPLAPSIREQIAVLSQPTRIPQTYLDNILASLPEPKLVFPTRPFKKRKGQGETPSERIKNSVSVLDFVSQFVDLDRNHRGLCPFHDDHHVSFQIDPSRNFWHCYSGCEGQTVIDFYMRWRELNGQDGSFKATIKELSDLLL